MKRYIKSVKYIFAMSTPRAKALESIDRYADTFTKHLIKCVVFQNSTNDLEHWILELSNYLDFANSFTIKPSNKKLKASDYEDTLFGYLGTTASDAKQMLKMFKFDCGKDYPEFDITNELVKKTYSVFQAILHKVLPILSSKNDWDTEDFAALLHNILK